MPTYLYICPKGHRQDAVRRIDDRDDCPPCACGAATERRITATMVKVFTPYRAVAIDKESGEYPLIRNADEHRAFLARNGYEEVGNDKSMAPLHPEDVAERRQRAFKERADNPAIEFDFNPDTQGALPHIADANALEIPC